MIEEIDKGLYKIEVPLPQSPLKELNAYLIKGKNRSLLIDNGFRMQEGYDVLVKALVDLDAPVSKMDFFITHLHADHCGLTPDIIDNNGGGKETKIYCSEVDGAIINATTTGYPYWEKLLLQMLPHGFSQEDLILLIEKHPAAKYCPSRAMDFTFVTDGDILEYGEYCLQVISTNGHTPGHLSLYDASREYLFSGDHILGRITPNIASWNGVKDSLADYLFSLDKVSSLDIKLTLPGHRKPVLNTIERIAQLKEHHQKRLEEVIIILRGNSMNAYAVASQMKWELRYDSWEDFPLAQKWFATGEALSHLEHLEALGEIKREKMDGNIFFVER